MPSSRILVSLVALGAATAGASTAAAESLPQRRCGTPQIPGDLLAPPALAAPGPQRIIYLNRSGATFQIMGRQTNSSTNVVSTNVSATGGGRTAVIPPLAADFDWPLISTCVTAYFAPYDVRVVETEPPAGTPFVEAIVGGNGTELGFGRDELFGIAAADNFCGVTETGVAFSFSETHRGVPQAAEELCATIAHEVGHLLALEHETLAVDLMSYVLVSDTTSKSFVNQASSCGVTPGQNQPCSCTSGTTNSAGRLGMFVGLKSTERELPRLRVVSPGADGRVPPLFTVEADASDETGMADVLVYLDGVEVGHDAQPDGDRYQVAVTAAIGAHTLAVVARDLAGNLTRVELDLTVALLPNGDACESGAQCTGGICATNGEDNFCTQTCTPGSDECGPDATCDPAGDGHLCVPVDGGGCCSAGGDARGPLLLAAAVGLLVLGRRRRARR
ncbi:MAG TPA: Ig-like domain-containing protein [Kofleriaceae bacterium]|jgi:hypothetical protein|nr:Ig-like domain-containing protein [Kofleriaceae bacterium]